MGDDLIERLRALSRHEHSDYSIGDEAAAEIETLRAEVERLTRHGERQHVAYQQAYDRAERLAEALRDARDYVTTALREEREKFAGYEDSSDIPGIEADLHKIDTLLREQEEER